VRVPSRVVLNGVDKDIFRPTMEKRKPGDETRFITTGNFRDKDMLVPVFDAMDLLVKEYPLRLEVAGFVKEELKPLLNRSYIDYIGDVDAGVVAERLARADAFIYSFLNPPCPNSVLEAVSAGIPVVSFDNGAMLEILRFNRDLLAQTNIRVIQRHRDLSSASLADKARCLIKDYPRYRLISQNNAYRYSVEEMMKQYLEVFENA
jgi:glycosyltransferase involved in cell wall biosynthesis